MIWIDFETSSECDLKARGVYNYARDLSTAVLCMAWAIGDEDVQVWTLTSRSPTRSARRCCKATACTPTTPRSSG